MSTAIVGLVDGFIPLWITEHEFLTFRCCIPVLPGGGGEDQPLAERTEKCQDRTRFLIGAAPTCPHHVRHAAKLAHINLSMEMEVRLGECGAGREEDEGWVQLGEIVVPVSQESIDDGWIPGIGPVTFTKEGE